MIFSRKNKLFWGNLTLTGALIFGAPVFALADKAPDPSEIQGPVRKPQEENTAVQKNGDSDKLSGKTDGNNKDRETDYSEEGQISKPSYSYESGPGTEGFVDDSTDNTYGYYTIMGTTTVTLETCVLLSKLKSTPHIEVEINLDEMDLSKAESKATYAEIKDYVLKNYGMNVTNLYIAQVKRKYGIIERINYNLGEGKTRVPQVTAEKEEAIEDALRHFQMIS